MSKPRFKTLIMNELKSLNLDSICTKIKSIRYRSFAGGDAVDVEAIDLYKAERETLEKILDKYEYGHFDGMTDSYDYKPKEERGPVSAKYVHLRNDWSEEAKTCARNELEKKWDIVDNHSAQAKMGTWYDTAIHRILSEIN